MLYSYACSYKARDEARVEGDAEYIPNKLQFSQSILDCTHDDLDTVLTMLGCKRFKSKKKKEKITLLLKAA